MAKKRHKFIIDAGIFPFELLVVIGMPREKRIRLMVDDYDWNEDVVNDLPFRNEPGNGIYIVDHDNMSYIFLPPYENTPHWHGVAAHELSHFAIQIMKIIGQDINTETWETYCYLTQYLTEEFLKNIKNG